MNRLGVMGTMVWDTIYGRNPAVGPVEEWGGIAYALAALEVALPSDWEIVPLIKVGHDLAPRANAFLNTLTRRSTAARFAEVAAPNNRVTLRYESNARRCEHLSGGVPPWRWEEVGPMVSDLDAIYVNFISGFEMTLETALSLRRGFGGPIYADLHSLFLGVGSDGRRIPQSLDNPDAWLSCFDVVQVNEDEMSMVGQDPMEVAARALTTGVRLLVVTLGARGAVFFTSDPFSFLERRERPAHPGPIQTARVPSESPGTEIDPTGCGDVFGGTLVARLAAGDDILPSLTTASARAARNLSHRGATNLHYYLRGQIAPR